jgi:addiction module HigA family antidote
LGKNGSPKGTILEFFSTISWQRCHRSSFRLDCKSEALLPPVHPGEILREDFMKPLGLTINKLALELHVPATRIGEIVHERRRITAETALRLARYFKTNAEFWLNLRIQCRVSPHEIHCQTNRDISTRSGTDSGRRSLTPEPRQPSFSGRSDKEVNV